MARNIRAGQALVVHCVGAAGVPITYLHFVTLFGSLIMTRGSRSSGTTPEPINEDQKGPGTDILSLIENRHTMETAVRNA
jgi:hypothetical protein